MLINQTAPTAEQTAHPTAVSPMTATLRHLRQHIRVYVCAHVRVIHTGVGRVGRVGLHIYFIKNNKLITDSRTDSINVFQTAR